MNTVSNKFSFQETYFLKNHECITQMVTLTFFILLFDDPMHPLKVKKDPFSKKDILGK
jgi:hypothetical protein